VNRRNDVVVRFRNSRNEEVGRLENEYAAWVSSLLDQNLCELEGTCVFAPDRIRTNDNIYIQLRVYLLRSVFTPSRFRNLDDNRETGLFEAKESKEEKELRLRQVAIVNLFYEINIHPTKTDNDKERQRKAGLIAAAETAEKKEQQPSKSSADAKPSGTPSSSPSSDDEEGEELNQNQLDSLYKKAQSFDFNTPCAEPAPSFKLQLRKYQKQALHWMMSKEKDVKKDKSRQSLHPLWDQYTWPVKDVDERDLPTVKGEEYFYVNHYSGELSLEFPVQEQNCLGGLLADEMGLGKTIEMMSLIHSHIDQSLIDARNRPDIESAALQPPSNVIQWAPATTLVVAPMSLLAQWCSEAEKASEAGSVNAMIYYGNDRTQNLGPKFRANAATTLPNIVITSYGTLVSEYKQVMASGKGPAVHGGLFSLKYFRVILDEAHLIKNRQSKTAKACYEIKARHRWVLSGTPIINRLEDLFSLVHFLKVEPWSNFSYWKTFITVPFENQDYIRALDVVQTVLEPLVLRRTKDMKSPDGEALVPLPPRSINIEKIALSPAEQDVYEFILNRAKRTFAANVEAGTVLKSYTTIFQQITRLRQSCCHPLLTRNQSLVADEQDAADAADTATGLADDMDLDVLLDKFSAEEDQEASKFGATVIKQIQDESESTTECPICAEEPMNDPVFTGCWHSACKQCLLDYIDHQTDKGTSPKCFNCREAINGRDLFEVIRHDIEDSQMDSQTDSSLSSMFSQRMSLRRVNVNASAKIAGLLKHLKKLRLEDPRAKSVVFSQFTSYLDLIEPALTRDHIKFLRLDGTISQKKRAAVIEEFFSRARGVVLLISLRAGGVGLNLTAAKRVFVMDPWWSFAVEAQAIDRVHRMGQESEVVVTRFIVEGSIEEKMLKIQERKKFM